MHDTDIEILPLGRCEQITNGQYTFEKSLGKKFSVLNINIRSLNSNFTGLLNLLRDINFRPTVIVVTETWLSDDTVNLYNITGYKKEYINRPTMGLVFYCIISIILM